MSRSRAVMGNRRRDLRIPLDTHVCTSGMPGVNGNDFIRTDARRWSSDGSPVNGATGSPLHGLARNENGLLSTCAMIGCERFQQPVQVADAGPTHTPHTTNRTTLWQHGEEHASSGCLRG